MQLLWVWRVLKRRKFLVASGLVLAGAIAIVVNYNVQASSPFVVEKSEPAARATTQLFVDFRESSITDATRTPDALSSRAAIYAQLAQGDSVARGAAKYAGVPEGSFVVASRVLTAKESASGVGDALGGGGQPAVTFTAVGGAPVINVEAQAPTADVAVRLADGASRSLREFLVNFSSTQRTPSRDQIRLRQLGGARGEVVSAAASRVKVVGEVLAIWLLIVLLLVARDFLRQQAAAERGQQPVTEEPPRVETSA